MPLSQLQTDQQQFAILSFDETEVMGRMLGLDSNEKQTVVQIEALEELLCQKLLNEVSAAILDPRFLISFPESSTQGIGYRLVESEVVGELPKFIPKWGVEETKNNYGFAKLHLLYHPAEGLALEKKKFVAEIYDYCKFENIPLLLDLELTNAAGSKIHPDELAESQLEAINELGALAHLIALDYPGNVLAAATITAELDTPWILSGREVTYDLFKQHLRESTENGAKGFMAGNCLWPELKNFRQADMSPDFQKIKQYLDTSVRDRVIECVRITNETGEKLLSESSLVAT